MDHLECAGGREGGRAVTTNELAGRDAHDGGRALGPRGENDVAHRVVDALRVSDGDGGVERLLDLGDQGGPVGA